MLHPLSLHPHRDTETPAPSEVASCSPNHCLLRVVNWGLKNPGAGGRAWRRRALWCPGRATSWTLRIPACSSGHEGLPPPCPGPSLFRPCPGISRGEDPQKSCSHQYRPVSASIRRLKDAPTLRQSLALAQPQDTHRTQSQDNGLTRLRVSTRELPGPLREPGGTGRGDWWQYRLASCRCGAWGSALRPAPCARCGAPGLAFRSLSSQVNLLEPKARCFCPRAFKKGVFGRIRAYPELPSNPCNFRSSRCSIPIPANSGLAGKKKICELLTGTLLWPVECYRLG